MSTPRILVSNDDGVDAPGIVALAAALRQIGDVVVVAPSREQSASSHAISLHSPLRIEKRRQESVFAVTGTPTDCIYLALHELLDSPPDIVVSGINHGPNLGNDVLYSGTVSAAMEGALFGRRAVAFSLGLPEDDETVSPSLDMFEPAARFAATFVQAVLDAPIQLGMVLNVNIPHNVDNTYWKTKVCRLGFTDWSHSVHARVDPRGKPYYWIGGQRNGVDNICDSDNQAMNDGHISITPIHYDLTDYRSFSHVRELLADDFGRLDDRLGSEPLPHPPHPKHKVQEEK